jgi:hypothetical protein
VITTFCGLLKALPPTDPVLVLGILDCPTGKANPDMVRDLFGFSRNNQFNIQRPSRVSDVSYWYFILELIFVRNTDRNSSAISFHTASWRRKTFPNR